MSSSRDSSPWSTSNRDGWHKHPFTIASAPADNVRITVGALGDFTSNIADLVEPGMPAVISSPKGHFDYGRGTEHQVWVAGGIGVSPMLSSAPVGPTGSC